MKKKDDWKVILLFLCFMVAKKSLQCCSDFLYIGSFIY